MPSPFDIVVVPDFTGSNSTFEMRTLFFRASWFENAGKAREFPLHVVCNGEPPASVRWMAQRCNVAISVHKPVRGMSQGFTNKLRGLEIAGQTEQVLLLDTDVFVLGDPSNLSDLGHCVAASLENSPKVPEAYWTKIYNAFGMELPEERVPSIRGELGCPLLVKKSPAEAQPNVNAMLPYYNGGIVFAPWQSQLRSLWEENVVKVAELFAEEERNKTPGWQTVTACDQVGFTVTIRQLEQQGLPFKQLPKPFHANWLPARVLQQYF